MTYEKGDIDKEMEEIRIRVEETKKKLEETNTLINFSKEYEILKKKYIACARYLIELDYPLGDLCETLKKIDSEFGLDQNMTADLGILDLMRNCEK